MKKPYLVEIKLVQSSLMINIHTNKLLINEFETQFNMFAKFPIVSKKNK